MVYTIPEFLNGEQIRLGILGFYPKRYKRNLFRIIIILIVYFITFSQMVTSGAYAALSLNDLSECTEASTLLITQIGFTSKLLNLHSKLSNVYQLENLMTVKIFQTINKNAKIILEQYFYRCQKVLYIFMILCFLVLLLFAIFPLIDVGELNSKSYPLKGKFLFNPDDYYCFVYSAQVLSVAISAWMNGTMDCLFTKHVVIATAYFQILHDKIGNLSNNITDYNDGRIEQRIKHCAIYYNKITKIVSLIETTFSRGILIQFICSAVVLCLTGFQLLLVVPFPSGRFGLFVIYLLCMMCQPALYCWHGQILMDKSNDITRACYTVDWINMNVKCRKMLIIIMERAKRPLVIHAGGVFTLNIQTMMKILRTSYSYFAVLQQLYE